MTNKVYSLDEIKSITLDSGGEVKDITGEILNNK